MKKILITLALGATMAAAVPAMASATDGIAVCGHMPEVTAMPPVTDYLAQLDAWNACLDRVNAADAAAAAAAQQAAADAKAAADKAAAEAKRKAEAAKPKPKKHRRHRHHYTAQQLRERRAWREVESKAEAAVRREVRFDHGGQVSVWCEPSGSLASSRTLRSRFSCTLQLGLMEPSSYGSWDSLHNYPGRARVQRVGQRYLVDYRIHW
jgi:hypothetical protein